MQDLDSKIRERRIDRFRASDGQLTSLLVTVILRSLSMSPQNFGLVGVILVFSWHSCNFDGRRI